MLFAFGCNVLPNASRTMSVDPELTIAAIGNVVVSSCLLQMWQYWPLRWSVINRRILEVVLGAD